MISGRQAHRTGTVVLSLLMAAVGVALTVEALASKAVVSGRLLLGVLFLAAGVGRLYVERRRGGLAGVKRRRDA
jgi:fucose permease